MLIGFLHDLGYQIGCQYILSVIHAEVASAGCCLFMALKYRSVQRAGLRPHPFLAASASLVPLREGLERNHRILLRDCRSFEGLGGIWQRIGLQSRRNNRRIVWAMREELKRSPLA